MNNPLQTENFFLRQQLEALLHEARLNEDKLRRFDQLERQLIGAGSLRELLRLLLCEYKQAFAVEFVTLALVDRDDEARRILASGSAGETEIGDLTLLGTADALEALYGGQRRPWLGDFDAARHQSLFKAEAGAIRTVALLPLTRQGELIGSLHAGSASADRYNEACGTDFLERLAQIVAICLENALSQERLKMVGLTDVLTGVQNRRYFEHRCPVEISEARRYKHPLACIFLDIDRFKRINDSYGHPTGDEVLRGVARLIQSQLRSGDTIARYGGEEFVALLPKSELRHAHHIAERIRASIEEKPFKAQSGQPIRVTISIGLSMLPAKNLAGDNLQCAEQLVADADQALYQAKHKGRNRIECAGGLPPRSARRLLSGAWRSLVRFPLALAAKARGA
jgi:two-component system, cell cycle response regulator